MWQLVSWLVTGRQLRGIVLKNKESGCGPDQWYPKQWALLPEGWFDDVAELWNSIFKEGLPLPRAWEHVKTALIPKPD